MSPKYSILVPVMNGMPYLRDCLSSILSIEERNLEIIVSDNGSSDDSRAFLSSVADERLRFLTPDEPMSMSEHWEYLLSLAQGAWQIFVGQDDALQRDFFEIAENLTEYADNNGARTISTRRAYYFWPGAEAVASGQRARYVAHDSIRLVDSRVAAGRVLAGKDGYFDLPHMYTTSLFRKEILDECRELFGGTAIQGHPQDAFLAAVACSLDQRFVRSEVPIGWVGTSIQSAGLAVSARKLSPEIHRSTTDLRDIYLAKINQSSLGNASDSQVFDLDLDSLYFWQAMRVMGKVDNTNQIGRTFSSRFLTRMVTRAALRMGRSVDSDLKSFLKNDGAASSLIFYYSVLAAVHLVLQKGLSFLKRFVVAVGHLGPMAKYNVLIVPISETPSLGEVSEAVSQRFTQHLGSRWGRLNSSSASR